MIINFIRATMSDEPQIHDLRSRAVLKNCVCVVCGEQPKKSFTVKQQEEAAQGRPARCRVHRKVQPADSDAKKECSQCHAPLKDDSFEDGKRVLCEACARAKRIFSKYGLSTNDIDKIRQDQKNRCCICTRPLIGNEYHIDEWHGHIDPKTGKNVVRGLLCPNHNPPLGMYEDSTVLCTRASRYLYKRGSTEQRVHLRRELEVALDETRSDFQRICDLIRTVLYLSLPFLMGNGMLAPFGMQITAGILFAYFVLETIRSMYVRFCTPSV